MLGVVPQDKVIHPRSGFIDAAKSAVGISGPVLQRLEQRFRIRVIIADGGRLEEGITPNRSRVATMVAPVIGPPLSEWSVSCPLAIPCPWQIRSISCPA